MPRYFFNIDDHPASPDGHGTELANDDAARREALRLARDVLDGSAWGELHGEPYRIRVVRDDGREIAVLWDPRSGLHRLEILPKRLQ